jgi:hypothetical protein
MTADEVYDILVKEAGAAEKKRADFTQRFGHESQYRFEGYLGSGGKVYYGSTWIAGKPVNDKMRVDCHLEDYNQIRKATIDRVNKLLAGEGT